MEQGQDGSGISRFPGFLRYLQEDQEDSAPTPVVEELLGALAKACWRTRRTLLQRALRYYVEDCLDKCEEGYEEEPQGSTRVVPKAPSVHQPSSGLSPKASPRLRSTLILLYGPLPAARNSLRAEGTAHSSTGQRPEEIADRLEGLAQDLPRASPRVQSTESFLSPAVRALDRHGGPATPALAALWLRRLRRPGEPAELQHQRACLARLVILKLALEALDGRSWRLALLRDLLAEIEAERGNALRLLCRYDAASLAFQEAYGLLRSGSGDPLALARVMGLEASWRLDAHQLPLGRQRALAAATLCEVLEEHGDGLRYRLKAAVALYEFGRPGEAANELEEAALQAKGSIPVALRCAVALNVALYRGESGEPEGALRLLEQAQSQLRSLRPSPRWEAHYRWIEGRLLLLSKRPAEALGPLQRATRAFQRLASAQDFALCSLDAAIAELRLGKGREATRRATAAWSTLRALDLPKVAEGAFLLILAASREGRLEEEMFQRARTEVAALSSTGTRGGFAGT